eukprot:3830378-Amphidinium_carterae.1
MSFEDQCMKPVLKLKVQAHPEAYEPLGGVYARDYALTRPRRSQLFQGWQVQWSARREENGKLCTLPTT